MITEQIKKVAESYIGKRETPNNSGFTDKEFEKRMKEVGWAKSLSWCSFFCELVWKEAYNSAVINKELDKFFSGSATATYKNFELSGTWKVSKKPSVGAVAIWRFGNDWRGHAGVVTEVSEGSFKSVEGNTNSSGGREGIEVAKKTRKLGEPFKTKGLNLVGFIVPKEV